MERKLYALLVGINDYPAPIPKLRGCVDDVNRIEYFLYNEYEDFDPEIVMLTDKEATYDNVVKAFREHLCQAGPNDIVFYHYSGHGSREPSAPEFKQFYPDGWDETSVLSDSRPEGKDLADKELAKLLNEVAEKDPHIVVSLDACHSGSGTRSIELTLRQISDKSEKRELDSYLDGYYAGMLQDEGKLYIPRSKHILFSGCSRYQTAVDAKEGGLYTTSLMNVLEKRGTAISYADLFTYCRAEVINYATLKNHAQEPQFESYEQFNAYGKFLDGSPVQRQNRHSVSYDQETSSWVLGIGAVHGLPMDPEKKVEIAIFKEDETEPFQHAETNWVGASISGIDFSHEDQAATFKAEIISLPVPGQMIYLKADKAAADLLKSVKAESYPGLAVEFLDVAEGCIYEALGVEGKFILRNRLKDELIGGIESVDSNGAHHIFRMLEKVVKWQRSLDLVNIRPQLSIDDIDFVLESDNDFESEGDSRIFSYSEGKITAKLKVRNRTGQQLFFSLFYYSDEMGIHSLTNDPIDPEKPGFLEAQPDGGFVNLWGDGPEDYLYLEDGDSESFDIFKLIVSTERVDGFLIEQEELDNYGVIMTEGGTRAIGGRKPKVEEKVKNDWFTKRMNIILKRK